MNAHSATEGAAGRRGSRLLTGLACTAAGLGALLATVVGWSHLTFRGAVAEHPVRAEAIVSKDIINGFGGDPALEYHYTVAGHTYESEGNGELGGEGPEALPGTQVAIEYAAEKPSESCTCDPRHKRPGSMLVAVILGGLLSAPLAVLLTRRRRQRIRPT